MDEQTYALATKAAWYYYMEDNTQAQIAEVMGISRAKVIRLLEEARAQGIVQFSFRKNDSQRVSAEQLLIDRFGLKDAFVVPTPLDSSTINQSIAQSAAHYVSDHLREDGYLNIGYGDTVSRMLGFLAKNREESLNVVSLTGGVSYYLPTVGTTAYSMRLFLTPSPLVVSSRQVRDALLDEKSLQDVSTMTEYADMSVVGIGAAVEGATVLRNGILNEASLLYLRCKELSEIS